jgi:hypothetical protein
VPKTAGLPVFAMATFCFCNRFQLQVVQSLQTKAINPMRPLLYASALRQGGML